MDYFIEDKVEEYVMMEGQAWRERILSDIIDSREQTENTLFNQLEKFGHYNKYPVDAPFMGPYVPPYKQADFEPKLKGKFLDDMPEEKEFKREYVKKLDYYNQIKPNDAPTLATIKKTSKDLRFKKNSVYDLTGHEDWRSGSQGGTMGGPIDFVSKNKTTISDPQYSLKAGLDTRYTSKREELPGYIPERNYNPKRF